MSDSETVTCIFCMCVMPFCKTDVNRLKNHMQYEHGIMFNVKFAIASCIMDIVEREWISDVLIEKYSIVVDEDTDDIDTNVAETHSYNIASFLSESKKGEIDKEITDVDKMKKLKEEKRKIELIEKQKSAIYKILEDDDDSPGHEDELLLQEEVSKNIKFVSWINEPQIRIELHTPVQLQTRAKESPNHTLIPIKVKESPILAQIQTKAKFKCEKCEISLARRDGLRRHMRSKHSNTNSETSKPFDTMLDVLIKDALVDSSGLSVFPKAVPLLLPNVSDIALDDLKVES
jgi:hypothetical protein